MNLVAPSMCMVAGIEALQSVVSLLLAHTLDCSAYALAFYLQIAGRSLWPLECQRRHGYIFVTAFTISMHTEGGGQCGCYFRSWPPVGPFPHVFGRLSFNGICVMGSHP